MKNIRTALMMLAATLATCAHAAADHEVAAIQLCAISAPEQLTEATAQKILGAAVQTTAAKSKRLD